jgi:RimJ/RimL family protein N-acetyltransferase
VIPTIETDRLLLRAFRDDDLDALAAIVADPETMRYIGPGTPGTRDDTWRGIAMVLGHWQLRGYGLWAAEEKDTGRLVGRVGLYNPEGWPGLEVGWIFARDTWGGGYATEGGRRSLRWAFEELGADHVISVIHPDNVASRRVAERLGGSVEREIDDFRDGIPAVIYGYDRPPPG